MLNKIAQAIQNRLLENKNLSKQNFSKKMEYNEKINNQNAALLVAENVNGKAEAVRAEVPNTGFSFTTIKLVLDARAVPAGTDDNSVLVGDAADLFKTRNPNLKYINPMLVIGGTYGQKTLEVLNRFILGANTRLHSAQGQSNEVGFWNNKEPMTFLQGAIGQDPKSVVKDFQMTVSDKSLNLTARLDNDFRFIASTVTALLLKVTPGEIITWTFKIASAGTGSLQELV